MWESKPEVLHILILKVSYAQIPWWPLAWGTFLMSSGIVCFMLTLMSSDGRFLEMLFILVDRLHQGKQPYQNALMEKGKERKGGWERERMTPLNQVLTSPGHCCFLWDVTLSVHRCRSCHRWLLWANQKGPVLFAVWKEHEKTDWFEVLINSWKEFLRQYE